MKLQRMLPEQIMAHWEGLRQVIVQALPPTVIAGDDELLNLQSALLLEQLVCWGVKDDNDKPLAVMTTQIVFDGPSKCKNLLIYTLTAITSMPYSVWLEGLGKLRTYAQVNNCKQILAYSNNPNMISVALKLGADDSYKLLSIPIY